MGCGDIWLRARSLPWSMPSWNLRFVNGNASGNRSLTLAPATALMAPNVLSALFTMSGLVVVHASQKEQRQVRAFLHKADRRSPTEMEHTRRSVTTRSEIARAQLLDTESLVHSVVPSRTACRGLMSSRVGPWFRFNDAPLGIGSSVARFRMQRRRVTVVQAPAVSRSSRAARSRYRYTPRPQWCAPLRTRWRLPKRFQLIRPSAQTKSARIAPKAVAL